MNATLPPTLAEVRARIAPLCQRYPIRRLEVFGSVAQGTAQPGSDVDLLVTLDGAVSTGQLLDMAGEAEELIGVPVDFVLRENVEAAARTDRRREMLQSAVCIYGG